MEETLSTIQTGLQFLAAFMLSLVAGATFGIWRGYNPLAYSAETFLTVHQGAVRGLNALLPGVAFVAMIATVILAFLARGRQPVLWVYIATLALMVAAGLITRFLNQPINAQVMTWNLDSMPVTWTALRDEWWNWHVARTMISMAAIAVLFVAVMLDRASLTSR